MQAALYIATSFGQVDVVKYLMDPPNHAKPHAKDYNGLRGMNFSVDETPYELAKSEWTDIRSMFDKVICLITFWVRFYHTIIFHRRCFA